MLRAALVLTATATCAAFTVPKDGLEKLVGREGVMELYTSLPATDCCKGAGGNQEISLDPDVTFGLSILYEQLNVAGAGVGDLAIAACGSFCSHLDGQCFGFTVDVADQLCILHTDPVILPEGTSVGDSVDFDLTRECFIDSVQFQGLATAYDEGVEQRYGSEIFAALHNSSIDNDEVAEAFYGQYRQTRYHSCGPTFEAGNVVPARSGVSSEGLSDGARCALECSATPGCAAVAIDYGTDTCGLVIESVEGSTVVYTFDVMSVCLQPETSYDPASVHLSSDASREVDNFVHLPYVVNDIPTSDGGRSSPMWVGSLDQCMEICSHLDDCYGFTVPNPDCDSDDNKPTCYIRTFTSTSNETFQENVLFEADACSHSYGRVHADDDRFDIDTDYNLDADTRVYSYSMGNDEAGYTPGQGGFVIHQNAQCHTGVEGRSVLFNPPSDLPAGVSAMQACMTACSKSPYCVAITDIHEGEFAGHCYLRFASEHATWENLFSAVPLSDNTLITSPDLGRMCYSKCLRSDGLCVQYEPELAVFGPTVIHNGVNCWIEGGLSMPVAGTLSNADHDVSACRDACRMYESCQGFVVVRNEMRCYLRFAPGNGDWTQFQVQESPDLNRDCHFKLSTQIADVASSIRAGEYRLYDNVNCWTGEGGHSTSVRDAETVDACRMRCDYSHECLGFVFLKDSDEYIGLGKCHLRYGSHDRPVFLQYSPMLSRQCHVKMNSEYGPGSPYWEEHLDSAPYEGKFHRHQSSNCWVENGTTEFAGSEIEMCLGMCEAHADCRMCIYDEASHASYMRLTGDEGSTEEIQIYDGRECYSKTDLTGTSGVIGDVIAANTGGVASSNFYDRVDDTNCFVEGGESMYVDGASLAECLDTCYYASHIIYGKDHHNIESNCLAVLFVKSTQKCYLRLAGEAGDSAALVEQDNPDRICYQSSSLYVGNCTLDVDVDSVGLPIAAARPACETCSHYGEGDSYSECSNAIVDLCYEDGFDTDAPVCTKPHVPCIFEEDSLVAAVFAADVGATRKDGEMYDYTDTSPYVSPCHTEECQSGSVVDCGDKVSEFCALTALAHYRLGPLYEAPEGCDAIFKGIGYDKTKTLGDKYRSLFCPKGWEPENLGDTLPWTSFVQLLQDDFTVANVPMEDPGEVVAIIQGLQEAGRMAQFVDPCDFDSFLMFLASVHNNLDVTTINTCGIPDSTSLIELGTVEQVFTHLLMSWGGLTMDQGFAAIGALAGSFYCRTLENPTLDSNCVRFANIWFETFDEVRLNSVTSIEAWAEGQFARLEEYLEVIIRVMNEQLIEQTTDLANLTSISTAQEETIIHLEQALATANQVVNELVGSFTVLNQTLGSMIAMIEQLRDEHSILQQAFLDLRAEHNETLYQVADLESENEEYEDELIEAENLLDQMKHAHGNETARLTYEFHIAINALLIHYEYMVNVYFDELEYTTSALLTDDLYEEFWSNYEDARISLQEQGYLVDNGDSPNDEEGSCNENNPCVGDGEFCNFQFGSSGHCLSCFDMDYNEQDMSVLFNPEKCYSDGLPFAENYYYEFALNLQGADDCAASCYAPGPGEVLCNSHNSCGPGQICDLLTYSSQGNWGFCQDEESDSDGSPGDECSENNPCTEEGSFCNFEFSTTSGRCVSCSSYGFDDADADAEDCYMSQLFPEAAHDCAVQCYSPAFGTVCNSANGCGWNKYCNYGHSPGENWGLCSACSYYQDYYWGFIRCVDYQSISGAALADCIDSCGYDDSYTKSQMQEKHDGSCGENNPCPQEEFDDVAEEFDDLSQLDVYEYRNFWQEFEDFWSSIDNLTSSYEFDEPSPAGFLNSAEENRAMIEQIVTNTPEQIGPLLEMLRTSIQQLQGTQNQPDDDDEEYDTDMGQFAYEFASATGDSCFTSAGLLFGAAEMQYLGTSFSANLTISLSEDEAYLTSLYDGLVMESESEDM